MGAWAKVGGKAVPTGSRLNRGGRSVHRTVFETGQPVRIDDYGQDSDESQWGVRSVVGVPIRLKGQVWGVIAVACRGEAPLPAGTEEWLIGFTELVTTAIANAQAQLELHRYAEEQAALRRVAVLVARAAPPEEVFSAVVTEAGQFLGNDLTTVVRYDADGTVVVLAVWSRTGDDYGLIGTRTPLGGRNLPSLVFATGQPARMDDYDEATGLSADIARQRGVRASVGVPISVEGRLWGAFLTVNMRDRPVAADTETRLAAFTELLTTAIANAQAQVELRRYAEEQAALRRVATLVARAAPPEYVFTAVATEAGQLLDVDYTVLSRYGPDGSATVVGGWGGPGVGRPVPVGMTLEHGGRNVHTMVFDTRRPARIDDYGEASGPAGDTARDWKFRSAVGAPIRVENRMWGVISVAYVHQEPLPTDTEARLAGFTELIGTALANAETQAALTASRTRIVAAADTARRRIERDLHDGAQQRLVSLALQLRAVQAALPPIAAGSAAELDAVADGLTEVLDELRALACGIHPGVLAKGGLRAAIATLARRSPVPVRLEVHLDERVRESVELAAYYVVAEALTNVAKHAEATAVDVSVTRDDGALRVVVRDDGRGGADVTGGSGLVGLMDRVEALGGHLSLRSPPGSGTSLVIDLPLHEACPARP
jgi:signal transduction histidine kinase